jgi:hypothetical protein
LNFKETKMDVPKILTGPNLAKNKFIVTIMIIINNTSLKFSYLNRYDL